MDKAFPFPSEKHREIYETGQKGHSFKEISETFEMPVWLIKQYYRNTEKRIQEYKSYHNDEKNRLPLELNIRFKDLLFLIKAFGTYKKSIENKIGRNIKMDLLGKRPYEYTIVTDLSDRLTEICDNHRQKFLEDREIQRIKKEKKGWKHIAMENVEQNFDFLTEKQRNIYKAVQNGSTYKQISIEAGVSYNTVRSCYLLAERRVREHKIADKFRGINDTQVIFSIVYGELLACIHTLLECKEILKQELSKKRVYHESLLNQRLHDCIFLLNDFEDLKEEILHKIK